MMLSLVAHFLELADVAHDTEILKLQFEPVEPDDQVTWNSSFFLNVLAVFRINRGTAMATSLLEVEPLHYFEPQGQ